MSNTRLSSLSLDELVALRDFFPKSCRFHWSGQAGEEVQEVSLSLFRQCQTVSQCCRWCQATDCQDRRVTRAENHGVDPFEAT